jgi:5-methylcytosine-specific restriction endonuclease McrA
MFYTCRLCGIAQPIENFHNKQSNKTGHDYRCKSCRKSEQALYRLKNSAEIHERERLYRLAYPERLKHNSRASRQRRPGSARSRQARFYAKHTQRVLAEQLAYQRAHPEQYREYQRRKRARKQHAHVVEYIDRQAIYTRDNWICQICLQPVQPPDATLDHIIPLSKGGEHSARNVVLAHRSCNSRKGNRSVPQQMRLLA